MVQRKRSLRKRGPGRPLKPIPRETFLLAARQVFAEFGYEKATVTRVAELTGVTKAAVLHHFGSKEKLYKATLESITRDLRCLLSEAFAQAGGYIERLDLLGERVVRYLGRNPEAARLIARESVDAGPFLETEGSKLVTDTLDGVVSLLDAALAQGEIVAQDTRQLGGSVVSLHLFWFAARSVSSFFAGGDPFSSEAIELRVRSVQDQVRRLCGAPVLGPALPLV